MSKTRELWINIYKNGETGVGHDSRHGAAKLSHGLHINPSTFRLVLTIDNDKDEVIDAEVVKVDQKEDEHELSKPREPKKRRSKSNDSDEGSGPATASSGSVG